MVPGLRIKLEHFLIGLTIALVLVPLFTLFVLKEVYAASCTWNGSIDNNLATNGNWDGCTVPTDGDLLVFPADPPSLVLNNDLPANTLIEDMSFWDGYTINGNAIDLGSGMINSSDGQTVIIAAPLRLTANFSMAATSGNVTFTGGVDLNGFDIDTSGNFVAEFSSGAIIGLGNINLVGGADTNFYAESLFEGTVNSLGARIRIDNSNSLGVPENTAICTNAAIIEITAVVDRDFPQSFLLDNCTIEAAASANANFSFSNVVAFGLGGATLDATNAIHFNLVGIIGNTDPTGDLNSRGLVRVAANIDSLDNGVNVLDGQLLLISSGTGNATYNTYDGSLMGDGYGELTAVNTGFGLGGLSPGDFGPGSMTIQDLTLATPGNTEFDLWGLTPVSEYDQVNVQNSLTLGGGISLVIGFTPTVGDSFVVINNNTGAPVDGTFTGYAEGSVVHTEAGLSYRISYVGGDGDDVEITVSPPPNVAPELTSIVADPSPAAEGDTVDLTIDFTDPDVSDEHTVLIDWGDGGYEEFELGPGVLTFETSYVYVDNPEPNPYTISVGVADAEDLDVDSIEIIVDNVDPALTNRAFSYNGSAWELSADIIDPGSLDSFTLDVDWGDGDNDVFPYSEGTTEFAETHAYVPGSYTIIFSITDKDGATSAVYNIDANTNVEPNITLISTTPGVINEGASTTLDLTFTDPDAGQAHTVEVTWDDGSIEEFELDPGVFTLSESHTYDDNVPSVYVISALVTDSSLGSDFASAGLNVNNVAPTLNTNVATPTNLNVNLTGNIVEPGIEDTMTISIDWGDGTADTVLDAPAESSSYNTSHSYASAGDYTITITIEDKDGGTNSYEVETTVSSPPVSSSATSSIVSSTSTVSSLSSATSSSTSSSGPFGANMIISRPRHRAILSWFMRLIFRWQRFVHIHFRGYKVYFKRIKDRHGNPIVNNNPVVSPGHLLTPTPITDETFTPSTDVEEGTYEWQVVAVDENDNILDSTPVAEVVISGNVLGSDADVPNIPQLPHSTPQGANSPLPNFQWTPSTNPQVAGYYVFVKQTEDAEGLPVSDESELQSSDNLLTPDLVTSPSFTPDEYLPQGTYEWQVIAVDEEGNILAETQPQEFTVSDAIPISSAATTTVDVSFTEPSLPGGGGGGAIIVALGKTLEEVKTVVLGPESNTTISSTIPLAAATITTAAVAVLTQGSFNGVLIGFFWPRRRKSWGLIHDLTSSKPVPLANIKLYDEKGVIITSTISDLQGIYGLLVAKLGGYKLMVQASGYATHTQTINLITADAVIDIGLIPDDSSVSLFKKLVTKYRVQLLNYIRKGLMLLMLIGYGYSIFAVFVNPALVNWLILIAYAVLTLPGLIILINPFLNQVTGSVVDASSGAGIAGVLIKMMSKDNQVSLLTNEKGVIKANLQPGVYQAVIYKNGYELIGGEVGAAGQKQLQVEIQKNGGMNQSIKLRRVSGDPQSYGRLDNPFRT